MTLPSARGQGEPLTGKLTPPGATIEQVLMAADDQKLLMASDAGYGFVCTFNDLVARNRAGKVMITLPDNAGRCRRWKSTAQTTCCCRSPPPGAC
ncbi:hypothetical protein M8494_27735 [Serratia ureilytica]